MSTELDFHDSSSDEKDVKPIIFPTTSKCTNSIDLYPNIPSSPKKWSPGFLRDENRKSAFQPYRQKQSPSCTVLTNLQRGNTQAEAPVLHFSDINFHTKAGQGEINEYDIKNEETVDVYDKNGLTALHWASTHGQYSAVQLLLDNGAEVDKLGPEEETALLLASDGGHHEVIKLLISHGADVNHVDHLCNTALMYAARGNHPHSCQELLMGGADITLSNIHDDTAFILAKENGSNLESREIVRMFEAQEINAEHKDLIHDVAYDFYGQRMATCSSDQYVKVWDQTSDGKWSLTSSWKAHSGSVWKVTWAHPEFGQVLATCSFDRTAAVWEEIVGETPGPGERGTRHWVRRTNLVDSRTSVTDVKFGPKSQGLQLATCSAEGIIRIYEAPDVMNLTQWTLQHEVQCKLPCSCLTWNPSLSKAHPQMLAVGSDDANPANGDKVFVYEYSENSRRWTKLETSCGVTDAVHDISFSPNLGRSFHILAVATKDVRIFNLIPDSSDMSGVTKLDVQTAGQFDDHGCTVWRVCWNVTGTILASSGDDGCVRMFKMNNINSWKPVAVLKGDGSQVPNENMRTSISNSQPAQSTISQTARYIKLGTITHPRDVPWH